MAQGPKKDPAAELRVALISALIDIPFMTALPDRRLLINLIRRDVDNFPDVQERAEARLHVVDVVLACLSYPGGLRALLAALRTMAPEASGTKRAQQLIESASLFSLLPDSDVKRIQELLRKADEEFDEPGWWKSGLDESVKRLVPGSGRLLPTFDHLGARANGSHRVPPALILVDYVAGRLTGSNSVELFNWAEEQAERFGVLDDFIASRRPTGEPPAEPVPNDAAGDHVDIVELVVADGEPSPGGGGTPGVRVDARDAVDHDVFVINRDGMFDFSTRGEPSDLDLVVAGASAAVDAIPPLGEMMPPVATAGRFVEKLPQVWGDVPQRNPNFTGRESLLAQLHEELTAARQTAVLPQALHGMGGVGKSHVAIEYVHRHSSEYDLIWWIPAEQPGQILDSLTKLARRLELDVSPEANSAVPVVREALSTGRVPYQNWLLVFDNAEAPDEVRQYFPTGGAGKILVTSRDLDWSRVTHSIEVDVFTRKESTTFLLGRNPELAQDEADRLAEALGDLPLAIEQAAAWLAATGMSVEEYLALLEQKRIELLDAAPSPDYRRSVAAAWKVSLDRLKEVNEAALQLLQVCSFFAPEPISRDLFAGSPTAPITPALDATLSDTFRLSRAIRDIQRYALARIDHRNNTLQIHRLIQAVLVGGMDDEERDVMRQGAHTLLANGNPNNPSRRDQWFRYLALRPHVVVSRAVESHDTRVHELVFGLAQFLYYWGDHAGSETLMKEVYHFRTLDRGEADPHTLRAAKWLGWMYFVNGKYAEARPLNQRTLAVYRDTFGDEDEGTLDAMFMVALDFGTAGDFIASRDLNERALLAARRAFGADDPATLICAHSLGVSLRLTGEYKRAAELDKDTHERRAVVLGPDDEATLNTLNGWVIDIREAGDYITARRLQEEVYTRHLAVFGPDAPATLRAARTLAVARRKAGDHPRARSLAEQTLEKYRRRYGEDFPDTLATALNFAVDLRHAGALDEARELGESTAVRYAETLGALHAYTLAARANLAVVLRLMNDVEAALALNREVLEALNATLGQDHAVTLTCATNLASDLYAGEDYQEAYELDIDSLDRSERGLGAEHPSTLALSVNLALDLRALGRINEADRILADTLTKFRRVLGDKHPATLNALQSLRADCDIDPMPL